MTLTPQTVREQVTNQIRDDLVSGRFEAGMMLRETELARRFGVSRGPVRDAFIQLSHEGYLTYQANRGVQVRLPPNPEDRKFITSLRQQIECHLIQKGIGNLTDESLGIIAGTLEKLKAACDSGQPTEIARRDIEFHEAIMVALGGEDLVGAWRQLCSRMLLTYSRHEDYDQAYQEHVDIYEALATRKAKPTIAAIKANIK